jgi:MFS family permease
MGRGRSSHALGAFAQTVRTPNLRRVQLSYGAAWASEWAVTVAVGILAFRHGGAAAVGIVGMVRMLPAALLAPAAGVVSDRYGRDHVLVGVGLVRGAALGATALLVAASSSPLPAYVLVSVEILAHTLYRPAHNALLPSMCTTGKELKSANVVRGLVDSLSALAGPLLVGLVVGPAGLEGAFALCALAALWSAWLIFRVEYESPPRIVEAAPIRPLHEIFEGLSIIRRKPDVALLSGLTTLQTFTRGCFSVFAVVVALQLLGLRESGVGVLTAGFGAGAVIGSFAAAVTIRGSRLGRWFAVGLALWGLPFIALAGVSSEVVALILLGLVGVANAIIDVALYTLLPWLVPEEVMGRVFTTLESLLTLGVAAGSLAASGLISGLGVRGALVAAGLVAPVGAFLAFARLRRLDAKVSEAGDTVALMQRVEMLQPLPLATISRLAAESAHEHFEPGTTIVQEGTRGDDFYVIVAGHAEVSVHGARIYELGQADCFGEIASLTGSRRTSTVRAETMLELLRFTGPQFVRAVTGLAPSTAAAFTLVDERLARAVSDAARTASSPELVALAGRHGPGG